MGQRCHCMRKVRGFPGLRPVSVYVVCVKALCSYLWCVGNLDVARCGFYFLLIQRKPEAGRGFVTFALVYAVCCLWDIGVRIPVCAVRFQKMLRCLQQTEGFTASFTVK